MRGVGFHIVMLRVGSLHMHIARIRNAVVSLSEPTLGFFLVYKDHIYCPRYIALCNMFAYLPDHCQGSHLPILLSQALQDR